MEIMFEPLTAQNVDQARLLNAVLFPGLYQPRFYSEVSKSIGQVYDGFLVKQGSSTIGGIICRSDRDNGSCRLYIVTLGVLAPYRREGLGRQLLKRIEELASNHSALSLYLHVNIGNDEAVSFYTNSLFQIKERIPNYYRRTNPPDAFLLQKDLM
ncbi:hypothetical protein PROFUN_08064 [Planoprotostelium fungivorum]|uniref:N-acetyltransferase domain-containing protein n=1 Tax=Planoprotostelium fungivorum TaxID=1890364 RepID=A0A2P6NKM9_9EUKA|nr:hypothetical protein PROFUN_08064 [Planoprotostelium fungivorum]